MYANQLEVTAFFPYSMTSLLHFAWVVDDA